MAWLAVLLLAVAAVGGAVAQDDFDYVMDVPADPDTSCGPEWVYKATNNKICAEGFNGNPKSGVPDPSCCANMALYLGPNSTYPSRNCFCIESVWTAFLETASGAWKINMPAVLDMCNNVGVYIPYYVEGGGLCNGTFPDEVMTNSAAWEQAYWRAVTYEREYAPARSLGAWFRAMPDCPVLLVSFIFMLLATAGCGLLAWPLVHDAMSDVADLARRKRR